MSRAKTKRRRNHRGPTPPGRRANLGVSDAPSHEQLVGLAAGEWGLSVGEYADAVDAHLANLFRGARLAIRMEPSAAEAVFRDGVIRCAADVRIPSRFVRGEPTAAAAAARAAPERAAGFQAAPVYAYATNTDEVEPTDTGIACYGAVRFLLRASVNDRATVTQGWFRLPFGATPAPFSLPNLGCCIPTHPLLLRRTIAPLPDIGADTHWEAYIHGGPIPLDDVERIDVIHEPYDDLSRVDILREASGFAVLEPARAAGIPAGEVLGDASASLSVQFDPLVQFIHEHCGRTAASPIHGERHWRRVATAGLELCRDTRGDALVVLLYALLHDAFRDDDDHGNAHGRCNEHGHTAADFAVDAAPNLGLTGPQCATLVDALRFHSDGTVTDDPTIAACWDADRLDLGRVGLTPDPRLLSTPAAIERAETWRPHAALSWRGLYLAASAARASQPTGAPESVPPITKEST